MRAVAVLLVVLDHLDVPGFRGGFIGVDVFFVISGYLITSLLAAEYAKRADAHGGNGSISIPSFYLRRARRILPAALTVILAVVVASRLLLNPLRDQQVQHDALWTLFFGANINCIDQATDYFAQFVAPSPFQHYWSLAVEEQFYLVWPALFLLVTRRNGLSLFGVVAPWRVRLVIAIGALGTASLAWSIVATADEPVSAYFSTFTRVWELALGALIGISTSRATQFRHSLAAFLSFGGTALLLIACVLIDASTPFPGSAALLPTLATALLIMAGLTAKPPLPSRALCLTPLRFLGRISYSVYLWHWPLIVFAAALYPAASKEISTRFVIFVLTIVLSILSFYLVEQPGRRVSLARKDARSREQVNIADKTAWLAKRMGSVAFGTCVLVALFVGVLSVLPVQSRATEAAAARLAVQDSGTGGTEPSALAATTSARNEARYPEVLGAWQRKVRAGLAIRTLPKSLQPLQPHLVRYVQPYCRKLAGIVAGECVVGGRRARQVAVLTGDSHAGMFQVAVSRALGRRLWRLHVFQRGHCGWAGSVGPGLPVSPSECRVYQSQAASRIRALHPGVLVLNETDVITPYRSKTDISASLASFSKLARRVIVLGHTPTTPPFDLCLVGSADISRCVGVLSGSYRADTLREKTLATRAGAIFVDTSAWFCVRLGSRTLCPPVIDNAPVWRDGSHVTSDLEPKLIPLIRAILGSAARTQSSGE
ncbi:MAG TPA: acyltransferase family protein [Gaiellaceae bacterium]|nr:acyltransferase family protein [Gaiellaceae bacterium]